MPQGQHDSPSGGAAYQRRYMTVPAYASPRLLISLGVGLAAVGVGDY